MTENSKQPDAETPVKDDTPAGSEDADSSELDANKGRAAVLADDSLGRSLDQLSRAFTASARRWELIVYPSLFAFVLLAAYGFFLIYSLTQDIGRVADTMDAINQDMNSVAVNMNSVAKNMVIMTQTVDNQSSTMHEMAMNMRGMNVSMAQMRYDISIMNNSVSRPMSFMNSFMPW